MRKSVNFQLYRDVDKKYQKSSNIIEPQIKTVSILKDNSMKIVYPLTFQLSYLQTLTSTKNYVCIFPSFFNGLSEVGIFDSLYHIFGKTRTSPFFEIAI